jgi:FKBP-type peptidyl-prolyl cis-trans isomerase SlyD
MSMTVIGKGSFVQFHFDLYTEDGSLVASTKDSAPLAYVQGVMETDPPALGNRLEGKNHDFTGKIVLPPEEAYGERIISYEDSIKQVAVEELLAMFPDGLVVEKGAMFQSEFTDQAGKKGQIWSTILDIQDDQAVVHFGHPLAGQTVTFDIEIVEVREATEDDIRQLYSMYNIE